MFKLLPDLINDSVTVAVALGALVLVTFTVNTEFPSADVADEQLYPAVTVQLMLAMSLGGFLSSSAKVLPLNEWALYAKSLKQFSQGGTVVVFGVNTFIEYKAATAITTIAIAIP
jgi:hypothetical protein